MFAGEGDAFRTNRRFKRVSRGMPAHAAVDGFDSVTLYGWDPDERPDIYGKVGQFRRVDRDAGRHEGAVRRLRSVRADDLGVDDHQRPGADASWRCSSTPRSTSRCGKFARATTAASRPRTRLEEIRDWTLSNVARHGAGGHPEGRPGPEHLHLLHRIRPQDDGRHPGIFRRTTRCEFLFGFDLRLSHRRGRREPDSASSPSRSPTASPTSRSYLARGMHIDDFAPNLSFFFSNGMDPEYSVIGRVARRIWAVAMKNKYGADERSQKLKYHVQTSGRSLHAQEMDFNDIRTTLQALMRDLRQLQQSAHQRLRRGHHDADARRACGAPWRFSSSSTVNGVLPGTRTPIRAASSSTN